MIRKLTLAVSALSLSSGLFAAPVTPEQALQRAVSSGPMKVRSAMAQHSKLSKIVKSDIGVASAYIFTDDRGAGFSILSADDLAVPVLGYSDSGELDVNNLPPSLVWWLNEQGRRVEFATSNDLKTSDRAYAPSGYPAIPVQMKTTWNQGAPYNLLTPKVGDVQSPTGCVATSFAQVMKYFNYPETGQGEISYQDNGRTRKLNFSRITFEWSQMQDSYPMSGYDEEQAKAVAMLMRACGYSVQMSYGTQSSGAVSQWLADAAKTYFKYDAGTYYTLREYYSYDDWFKLIYDNIKNVGPVIYDGRSVDGGHSFVCDGYDGNGYFHFNWGWGGMSDGFYVLDALNPENQGIGGASGGFNCSQGAVIGMKPAAEGSLPAVSNIYIYGNAEASLSGQTLTFSAVDHSSAGWGNAYATDMNVVVGAIISDVNSGKEVMSVQGTLGSMENVSLSPVSYFPTDRVKLTIDIPVLPDGKYKVTLATKDNMLENAKWLPMVCDWGKANYCILTVENGAMSVSNVQSDSIEFVDSSFVSPLFFGRNLKIVSKVKNTSDKQLSLCYMPVLYRDGAIQYLGDMTMVTVDPKSEIEKPELVHFIENYGATATDLGTYQLRIVDAATNDFIGIFGEYEMTVPSSTLKVEADEYKILDAQQQPVTVGTRTFDDVYIVKDAYDFEALLKYTVSSGYLDSELKIIGARYDAGTGKFMNMDDVLYSERPYSGEGQTKDVNIPFNFKGLDLTSVYRLSAGYMDGGKTKPLGVIYVAFDLSGVDDVMIDSQNQEVTYFNLQGVPVYEPQAGQIVIRRCGDKIEKIRY